MSFDPSALGGIFEEMSRLQQQLADAEAEAGASSVEGSSGGGAVRIRASGEFSFDSVSIDPSVLEGADASLIEDLVLAALRDTVSQLTEVRRSAMSHVVGGAFSALLGVGSDASDQSDDEVDDDLSEDDLSEDEQPDDDTRD